MIEEFYYLNDREKEELQKFMDNDLQSEAVRKVLLSGIYFDGILAPGKKSDPLKNFMLGKLAQPQVLMNDDKHLGALSRSIIDAISMVESGFEQLKKFKKVEVEEKLQKNKAR